MSEISRRLRDNPQFCPSCSRHFTNTGACPDEWHLEYLQLSIDSAAAGRVLPWRIALLPLPGWVFWVLFHWIAPWTWGRKIRRLAKGSK